MSFTLYCRGLCPGRGVCSGSGGLCSGRGVSVQRGLSVRGWVGGLCQEDPPPVNKMINRCKNITLPQTSFAGGKNAGCKFVLVVIELFNSDVNDSSAKKSAHYDWVLVATTLAVSEN